jgi:hypothetical protein
VSSRCRRPDTDPKIHLVVDKAGNLLFAYVSENIRQLVSNAKS